MKTSIKHPKTSLAEQLAVTPQKVHAAHECWRNESALWHEELKLWQDELHSTRDDLAKVMSALEAHGHKLQQHGASLTLYNQQTLEHEHALAENARHGGDGPLAELAQVHHADTERHSRERQAHELLKHLHHAIIARCSLLLKAVGDAGGGVAKRRAR